MPLSEREQKILQEIERDLYREDPAFARDVSDGGRWDEAARARAGALLVVAGLVSLLGFFVAEQLWLGVVAFGAMVAGVVLIAGSVRTLITKRSPRAEEPSRRRVSEAVRRLEERIRHRYRGGS